MWEYRHKVYISSMGPVPHVHSINMVIAGAREVIVSHVTCKQNSYERRTQMFVNWLSYDIAV